MGEPASSDQLDRIAAKPWHSIRRGVWIGLPLVAVCSVWVAYGEIRIGAELVNSSLMIPSVFLLFLFTVGNVGIARRWPKIALDRRELLTIYALLIVSICIGGKGMMEMLLPTIAEGRFYAQQRRWTNLADALPRWWEPRASSLTGFFSGHSPLPWRAWLIPFATWGGFLIVLLFTTFCICLLLRRQWIHRERLVFPIAVLPLELTRSNSSLVGSPTMWIAFTLVLAIESLNSLHQWFPSLPHVPIKAEDLDISAGFTDQPWRALRGWSISFYPFAIGIAYLLTTEVSLGCWIFYILVTKIEVVFGVAMGWRSQGSPALLARFPYISEQGAGAYFGFALLVLWIARRPVIDAWSRLIRGRRAPAEGESRLEWIAAIGLGVGLGALIAFCLAGGARLTYVLLFWAVTLAFVITLTRARAEGGTVWALGPDTSASMEVLRITGTAGASTPSLVMLVIMQFFSNDWRALVMPNQLESMKIADAADIPLRRLIGPITIATLLGIMVSFWASLAVWYHYGCASGNVDHWAEAWGNVPWAFGRSWSNNPKPTDVEGLFGVAIGALTVFILSGLRTRLLWWPLHPIGYVLGSSGDLDQVWFCFFLGWLIKTLTLRYGGGALLARALPFFLGLILGDYAAAAIWTLIGMIFNVPVYKVFP